MLDGLGEMPQNTVSAGSSQLEEGFSLQSLGTARRSPRPVAAGRQAPSALPPPVVVQSPSQSPLPFPLPRSTSANCSVTNTLTPENLKYGQQADHGMISKCFHILESCVCVQFLHTRKTGICHTVRLQLIILVRSNTFILETENNSQPCSRGSRNLFTPLPNTSVRCTGALIRKPSPLYTTRVTRSLRALSWGINSQGYLHGQYSFHHFTHIFP